MGRRGRVRAGGVAGLFLAAATVGTSLGAVDVVELSAQQVVAGSVVTLRVATTATEVMGPSGALFLIPSGTFGDSPESLRCEQVPRAIEVGRIAWTPGTVEYQGASYPGVTGETTFTVPELPVDTYRIAVSIDATGTGCHIFGLIHVVAELPDTALPGPTPALSPNALGTILVGVTLWALAAALAGLRTRRTRQTWESLGTDP